MSQRVSVGDRSSMLVARAIDNQEVEKLTLDMQNACESILGSRNVAQYIPEIQLLGTLLYYSFSLKTRCSTPGQDYTNMMMVTRGKERTIGDASGPFGQVKIQTYRKAQGSLRTKLTLFAALLPYLYLRLPSIVKFIKDEINKIYSDNDNGITLAQAIANDMGNNNDNNNNNSNMNREQSQEVEVIDNEEDESSSSACGWSGYIGRILDLTFTNMGVTESTTARLRSLCQFIEVFHQFVFHNTGIFLNSIGLGLAVVAMSPHRWVHRLRDSLDGGRFLEIPYRLSNIEMLVRSDRHGGFLGSAGIPQRALGWMLGMRLGIQGTAAIIQSLFAARIAFIERKERMEREREREREESYTSTYYSSFSRGTVNHNQSNNNSNYSNSNSNNVEEKNDNVNDNDRKRKCALCLGTLNNPATTPCGHIYCWNCIISWTQRRESNSASTVGRPNAKFCPVCRSEIQAQKIRALYCYS